MVYFISEYIVSYVYCITCAALCVSKAICICCGFWQSFRFVPLKGKNKNRDPDEKNKQYAQQI